MLRLWRSAGRIDVGPAGVKPWLRRVVSNLCIDRVRAGRNTDVVEEVPEQPQAPIQIASLEAADTARRVEAALRALPERQRLALVLFHYEGMSQIEVARAMGISDEAVESLLSRARRTLRTTLADAWRDLDPPP
jgi:RNA polymerase sigma-70 factor (ECF subfamily)